MRFEVAKRDGSHQAWLHSVDSSCHGSVSEQQLRAFAKDLVKVADGKLDRAEIHIPWEPEGP